MPRIPTFAALVVLSSLVGVASVPGCIAVIGNDASEAMRDGSGPRRIRLSSEERESLPRVTSVADLPRVQTKYAAELRQLSPSTTLDQFKGLFPGARFVERRSINGNAIDAYAVMIEEKYRYRGDSYGYLARDEQWFFFKDNLFVKTADPNQWP